jgi:hypothetical protein
MPYFTWNGQLYLSAEFNKAYYQADFVEKFLQDVKENEMENLGIGKTA